MLRQSLDSVASGACTTLPESQNHTSFFKFQEPGGNINLLQHSVHTVSETLLTMKSNIIFFSVYDEGRFLRKVILCFHCFAFIFRTFPCKGKQAKVLGGLKEKKKIKFSANSNYRDKSQGWVVHFSCVEERSHMILWVAVHLSIFPAFSAEVSPNYAELGCFPPSSFIIKLPAVSMKGRH